MNDLFDTIIGRFEKPNVSDEEICSLIERLAYSGDFLRFDHQVFDFASTGGPSSLSTLLVPLYLYAYGVNVINISVPGRPAGAVDVLAQIPEYKYSFNSQSAFDFQGKHFYLHLEADECFVPFDMQLFDYRRTVNKINIPNLAIASLLAKKVAGGASNIGLDVRISPFGNFGISWEECKQNAEKYNRLAKVFDMKSICFLSDASIPYQQYIGRGEALIALHKVMNGQADSCLGEHDLFCQEMAKKMTSNTYTLCKDRIKEAFSDNLLLQGSKFEYFEDAVKVVMDQPYREMHATLSGLINYNLHEIRRYLVNRQLMDKSLDRYPDPSGIVLLSTQGTFVNKGQPILLIRNSLPQMEAEYSFFEIKDQTISSQRKVEVI